ncbi:unnamed protein product [Cuscuta epithymum]|uniref:NAC domain-containing protein n=1 Tax=Cuscuta epithymum TaxID=186058 RepID=A0AAV0G495_9ASTE|nr:unnamed protein product [Cuscuta epithymum]
MGAYDGKAECGKRSDGEEEGVVLPGFRFHPTDEELVGFYLTRKVANRNISIEIIKQLDIYKYDPWDLPRSSAAVAGDSVKEWYFFCIRGRKYKNSVRPNRVTGSGFWKATGIDKPVFSSGGGAAAASDCIIGLKKSLVFYRGNAGKGTKTDWMMHEFRMAPPPDPKEAAATQDQAEIWTLCRIFKRNTPNHKRCSGGGNMNEEAKEARKQRQNGGGLELVMGGGAPELQEDKRSRQQLMSLFSGAEDGGGSSSRYTTTTTTSLTSLLTSSPTSCGYDDRSEYLFPVDAKWDELKSVVGLATTDPDHRHAPAAACYTTLNHARPFFFTA